MNIEQTLQEFKAYLNRMQMLKSTMSILNFDSSTIAPKGSIKSRSKRAGFFEMELYQLTVSDTLKSLLQKLEPQLELLSPSDQALYRIAKKSYEENTLIPADLVQKFAELTEEASHVWEEAKKLNDFQLFAPYLEEVVRLQKEMLKYRSQGQHPYDVLLNDYEEGMSMAIYNEFFSKLKAVIVPLLHNVTMSSKTIDTAFLKQPVPLCKQRRLSTFLAEKIGFDLDRGYIGEASHPFCGGADKNDVRITTRYNKNDFISSFYSIMHECGHAIYEQNIADDIDGTLVGKGISMGFHESQSRFYENMIGRSPEFWAFITDELKTFLPEEFQEATPEQFFEAVNESKPSLIRVEADELTYCLHIMIRYEMEKLLFDSDINVKELPAIWNQKYQDYLGITPESDAVGILQDIHWSAGLFGYFPTYALGSAYAAQFLAYMRRDLDIEDLIRQGDFAPITAWLTERIHQYGSIYQPNILLERMAGEQLNADYFTEYLKNKFEKLYQI